MALPSPTIMLGAALAFTLACGASFVAGKSHGHGAERVKWEASTAKLKAEAATKLADAEKRKSDADNANIIAALELQDTYEKRIKAMEDNNAGSGDRIADSVRRIAAKCGGGGGNAVPGETPNPVSVPAVPQRSRDQLLAAIGSDFDALGKSADRLKEKFRACFDWAHQNGR